MTLMTSRVAENGNTNNPSRRSATAKLAIRMCVGPLRLELVPTAARISILPPTVKPTMTHSTTATNEDVHSSVVDGTKVLLICVASSDSIASYESN